MTKQYMGQIMAECDCQHYGCEIRGYCMAEKIVQLEQKGDEVERRRVKWMNKSDDAEARLAKAVEALRAVDEEYANYSGNLILASMKKVCAVLAEIGGS